MMLRLPIRIRIGDLPEHEIGTITLSSDESVYAATADALQSAAELIRSLPTLGALPRRRGANPRAAVIRGAAIRAAMFDEALPAPEVTDMVTGENLTGAAAEAVLERFLAGLRTGPVHDAE